MLALASDIQQSRCMRSLFLLLRKIKALPVYSSGSDYSITNQKFAAGSIFLNSWAMFDILSYLFRLSLKCTLLGYPKPTVTWEKDGELVDEEKTGGHIQTRIEGNDFFLEIDQTNPEDSGKYCVTARNSLGKQTAAVDVSISGKDSGGDGATRINASFVYGVTRLRHIVVFIPDELPLLSTNRTSWV